MTTESATTTQRKEGIHMSHSTFRAEKIKLPRDLKGLCTEHDRTPEMKEKAIEEKHFQASCIDWNRTKDNVVLERAYEYKDWENGAWECEKGLFKKHSIKPRKDAVLGHDTVYIVSPEWFQDKSKEEIIEKFKGDLEWHKKHFGVVIDAVIHFDETTPHMHVISVPLYQDKKNRIRLSAKHYVDGPKSLERLQHKFYQDIAKEQGFEECEHREAGQRKKHITNQEHKINELAKQEKGLINEISVFTNKLREITVIDDGKRLFGRKKEATVTKDYEVVEDMCKRLEELKKYFEGLTEQQAIQYAEAKRIESQSFLLKLEQKRFAEKEARFDDEVIEEARNLMRNCFKNYDIKTVREKVEQQIIKKYGLEDVLDREVNRIVDETLHKYNIRVPNKDTISFTDIGDTR